MDQQQSDPPNVPPEENVNHEEQPDTAEMDEVTDPTILDLLNSDCWKAILDNLIINEIVQTETVSRAWQEMIIEYLSGVHKYQVGSDDSEEKLFDCQRVILKKNKESNKDFCGMIKKLGPLITKLASNCVTRNGYKAMSNHCPNLEDLTLYGLQMSAIIQRFPKVYDRLKRLKFDWCDCFEDDCLNLLVLGKNIEELTINQFEIPATFLCELKWSPLKTLSLNYCEYLLFDNDSTEFLTAMEASQSLRKLVLDRNSVRVIRDMHLLLSKLPNLEELSINYCKMMEPRDGDQLVGAIGGLTHLKCLRMKRNNNVSDSLLEAVGAGCKKLEILDIGYCVAVSGRAVVALCRALPRLAELSVAGNPRVADDHLITSLGLCPDLRELDARGCSWLSRRLVRAARARRRPLRMRLHDTTLTAAEVIEDLGQNGEPLRMWAPVHGCFWTPKVTRMAQQGDLTLVWNESPIASPSSSEQDEPQGLWTGLGRENENESD